jgi:hypothetical protein
MSNPEQPEEPLTNSKALRDIASFAVLGAIVGSFEGMIAGAITGAAGIAIVGYKKFRESRDGANPYDYPPNRHMDI